MTRKTYLARLSEDLFKISQDNRVSVQMFCQNFLQRLISFNNLVRFIQETVSARIIARFMKYARNIMRLKLLARILQEKTISARILQVSQFLQKSARSDFLVILGTDIFTLAAPPVSK